MKPPDFSHGEGVGGKLDIFIKIGLFKNLFKIKLALFKIRKTFLLF